MVVRLPKDRDLRVVGLVGEAVVFFSVLGGIYEWWTMGRS